MLRYMTMSKWQFSFLALANFLFLADYLSVKLTSEVSSNYSCVSQIIEILPDNIALPNKES